MGKWSEYPKFFDSMMAAAFRDLGEALRAFLIEIFKPVEPLIRWLDKWARRILS